VNSPDGLPPLREVIRASGLSAKKSLGQNFLLDFNLTRRAVSGALVSSQLAPALRPRQYWQKHRWLVMVNHGARVLGQLSELGWIV
jgi:hypothetical protein